MRLLGLFISLLISQFAHAGAVITYHGRLVAPSGAPVESSNVSFNIRVLSPQSSGSCVLYEEQRTVNMTASGGVFVIPIGDGAGLRTTNDPGFQIEKVFTNSAGTVFNKPGAWDSSKYFCNSGSSYSPSSLDGRQLIVSFKDGGSAWQVLPNMDVTFVPFSVSSYDAQNIGGTPSQSVLRVAGGNAAAMTPADFLELQKLINGTSTSFSAGGGSGSVTSVIAGSGLSGGTITSSGTIAIANGGVGSGHLASGAVTNDKVTSVDWAKLTSVPTAIQNAGSDITALQSSLATTNSNLTSANTNVSNLTTAVGTKITQPSSCSAGQLLSFVSVIDWACVNAPSSSDKLPLAGGTMTGALNMGSNAINNISTVQAGAVSAHAIVLSGTVPPTPPEGALWYDAGVLKYRGPSSDLSLGTVGSQWQDATGGLIYSAKGIGIGNNLPAEGVTSNAKIYVENALTNTSMRGINATINHRSDTSGSYSNLAGVFKAQETIATGVTNSAGLTGVWSVAFRNNRAGLIDNGILSEMTGVNIQYGHYNSEASSTATTTEAYGVRVAPYYKVGTIGTMFDFYAHPGSAGGAVTKHYGLHIGGPQKVNFIEGKLGIGTNSPTEALDVNGKVKATELCIGTNCISSWPSGASSGTVTQVNAGTGLSTTSGSTSSGGNITTSGSLYLTNTGVTAGTYGSATSVPVFEVDAQGRVKTVTSTAITGAAPTGSASGDLGGTYPSPTVDKIKGQSVSATATTTGQVLRFSGSSWTPSSVRLSELASSTGVAGSALNATSCTASQTLNWSSITDKLECQNIAGLNANVLTAGTIDNARLPASATYWQAATGGINYASGNVGIGTLTPLAKLDLNGGGVIRAIGATAADGLTVLSNAATADQGGMYLTNSAAFVTGTAGNYAYKLSTAFTGNATNSTLRFGVVNANAPNTFLSSDLTLKGGKVGIGTTTPLTSLDVSNTGGAALSVRDNAHLVTDDAFETYIQGVDSTNTVNWYLGDGSSGKLVGFMAANPNYKLFLGTNGVERLTIDDAGKIGIGTKTPAEKLQVVGNIESTSATTMNSTGVNAGLRIFNSQSANSDYLNIGWMGEDLYGIQSADVLTHKGLVLNPYGGNVGVGTGATAPLVKLDVAGGVKMGSHGTCDATFEGTQRYNSTSKTMEFCNGAAWVSMSTGGGGLGVGQTWTDVKASRVAGTTYTNSSGKPIQIMVTGSIGGAGSFCGVTLTVQGIVIGIQHSGGANYSQNPSISAVIPDTATYKAETTCPSFAYWSELR